ncbi:uncharacterized protein LOC112348056 isoform X2 [Selaginella moellendorffii]|uniref:uncharacterized protein LOC112348056 isoform X2 n=1 Tax=Selaginella moellendorffii TaxID=88036 RepID=UPI000D1CCE57|nr:uncharacterized protein LOC112348056 isoform X2 [Selaginella moellendorffii]|eukprot:XP_024535781.1 uncharacterized protein LOC112348056 isoform X2 [Selaginella moellendorffii]
MNREDHTLIAAPILGTLRLFQGKSYQQRLKRFHIRPSVAQLGFDAAILSRRNWEEYFVPHAADVDFCRRAGLKVCDYGHTEDTMQLRWLLRKMANADALGDGAKNNKKCKFSFPLSTEHGLLEENAATAGRRGRTFTELCMLLKRNAVTGSRTTEVKFSRDPGLPAIVNTKSQMDSSVPGT